jgi:hypothetical protein
MACGTLPWQEEKWHHGQFLQLTVIGEQVACKENKSGRHHEKSETGVPSLFAK